MLQPRLFYFTREISGSLESNYTLIDAKGKVIIQQSNFLLHATNVSSVQRVLSHKVFLVTVH